MVAPAFGRWRHDERPTRHGGHVVGRPAGSNAGASVRGDGERLVRSSVVPCVTGAHGRAMRSHPGPRPRPPSSRIRGVAVTELPRGRRAPGGPRREREGGDRQLRGLVLESDSGSRRCCRRPHARPLRGVHWDGQATERDRVGTRPDAARTRPPDDLAERRRRAAAPPTGWGARASVSAGGTRPGAWRECGVVSRGARTGPEVSTGTPRRARVGGRRVQSPRALPDGALGLYGGDPICRKHAEASASSKAPSAATAAARPRRRGSWSKEAARSGRCARRGRGESRKVVTRGRAAARYRQGTTRLATSPSVSAASDPPRTKSCTLCSPDLAKTVFVT